MKRTQRFLICVALPVLAFSLVGCGGGSKDPVSLAQVEPGAVDNFESTGFVLSQKLSLTAISDDPALDRRSIILEEGAEIAVIERKDDPNVGSLVRIGLDVEEGSELPSDFWIRAEELPASALIPFAPAEDIEDSAVEQGDEIDLFRKKMTYCYRYVKQYLLQTGKVKVYLPGVSAWQAAGILPKHGFRKTGNTPASARNGEVCVYSGGPKGHGHIEVKRNGKWWYGYGFKANPIANRRFIGCFYK